MYIQAGSLCYFNQLKKASMLVLVVVNHDSTKLLTLKMAQICVSNETALVAGTVKCALEAELENQFSRSIS